MTKNVSTLYFTPMITEDDPARKKLEQTAMRQDLFRYHASVARREQP